MNQLISALGARLASVYGAAAVSFGDADQDVIFPYIVYNIQGSGATEYHSCDRNLGSITSTAIQIIAYSYSSVTTGDMLKTIIADIDGENFVMESDLMLRADKIDEAIFVEPDRDQNGKRVWQGVVIFEFVIAKGA